jgi:release factor glutamine methyltransferase
MPTLLSDITSRLAPVSDTPALDASVLISHILNKPRTWVVAHPELTLTTEQGEKLDSALARLEGGEPLPYVLGHWEFFGLDFEVTPDVLIPRPETELLVEKALAWLKESPVRRPSSTLRIADVGTGSGIIGVTIALEIPSARVLATDISPAALRVAQNNASKFNVADRINFVECDILLPHPKSLSMEEHFDLLCANLPYIPSETLRGLPVYGREPSLALDGGADGLDLFRKLMRLASEWMAPNSLILLEIESTLGVQALNLACDMFSSAEIHLHKDLAGRDRLLEIML